MDEKELTAEEVAEVLGVLERRRADFRVLANMERLGQEIASWAARKAKITADVQALEQRAEKWGDDIVTNEAEVVRLRAQIAALADTVAQLEEQRTDTARQLGHEKNLLTVARNELSLIGHESSKLRDEVVGLEERHAHLVWEIDDLLVRRDQVRDELHQLAQRAGSL